MTKIPIVKKILKTADARRAVYMRVEKRMCA